MVTINYFTNYNQIQKSSTMINTKYALTLNKFYKGEEIDQNFTSLYRTDVLKHVQNKATNK